MAEIDDRLVPRDGLNTYNVLLTRMELPTQGSADFTFAVTCSMLPAAELRVQVPLTGQSLDRMTVEAHDALLDILRQLMFRADKARRYHEKHAISHTPLPVVDMQDELEFSLERRSGAERRLDDEDPGFEKIAPNPDL